MQLSHSGRRRVGSDRIAGGAAEREILAIDLTTSIHVYTSGVTAACSCEKMMRHGAVQVGQAAGHRRSASQPEPGPGAGFMCTGQCSAGRRAGRRGWTVTCEAQVQRPRSTRRLPRNPQMQSHSQASEFASASGPPEALMLALPCSCACMHACPCSTRYSYHACMHARTRPDAAGEAWAPGAPRPGRRCWLARHGSRQGVMHACSFLNLLLRDRDSAHVRYTVFVVVCAGFWRFRGGVRLPCHGMA